MSAENEICPAAIELDQLLRGELEPREEARLERHIELCADCQQRIERLAAGERTFDSVAQRLRQAGDCSPKLRKVLDECVLDVPATRIERPKSDVTTVPPKPKASLPSHVGEYEVLDLIGKGGMGLVLKCRDPKLNRIVAIKVLSPRMSDDETCRQRFLREARAAAAINQPNVVTIYAVVDRETGESGVAGPYIVMEFVDGPSLREYLERQGPLSPKQVAQLGVQIAQGLAAAHARGVIHRDIKPANIVMDMKSGRVKLTDFGLARLDDDQTLTRTGVIAGTPAFMSPEQALGKPLDHRSDLFSLGSVLYVLCSGHLPFEQTESQTVVERVLGDDPQHLEEVTPEIPRELADIIRRLHAKNPSDRIDSALEVVRGLKQLVKRMDREGWGKVPTRSKAELKTTPTQVENGRSVASLETVLEAGTTHVIEITRRRRVLIAGAIVVVGLLLVGAGAFWNRSDPTVPVTKKVDPEVEAWLDRALGNPAQFDDPQDVRLRVLFDHREERFDSLNSAARAIRDGQSPSAVIIVRGQVPMPFEPLSFGQKRVTIIAAAGERAVLRSHVTGDVPLIETDNDLQLEGIVLQQLGGEFLHQPNPPFQPFSTMLRVRNGRLRAANCRFEMGVTGRIFEVRNGPGIEVINSEIHNLAGIGLEVFLDDPRASTTARFENCVARCARFTDLKRLRDSQAARLDVSRSTIVCERFVEFVHAPLMQMDLMLKSRWNVTVTESLLHANASLFAIRGLSAVPPRAILMTDKDPSELPPLLPRWVLWSGNRNQFGGPGSWLVIQQGNDPEQVPRMAPTTLADWQQMWRGAQHDQDSIGSPSEFVEMRIARFVGTTPHEFPQRDDFMTKPAAKITTGPKLSEVGPGEPYSQWLKSEAASAWVAARQRLEQP